MNVMCLILGDLVRLSASSGKQHTSFFEGKQGIELPENVV